ncbi:MAG TPA: hypothetical protein DEP87_04065 [Candidatus Pacebacteria bacterium]|nr:hypothetical protein [Candidatus Paceibacterota bacterium]
MASHIAAASDQISLSAVQLHVSFSHYTRVLMLKIKSQTPASKSRFRYLPREKFLKFGIANLTEIELIALILRSGTTQTPLPKLAHQTWMAVQSWHKQHPALTSLSVSKFHWLENQAGLGLAKASSLYAAIELGRRLQNPALELKINHPEKAFLLAGQFRHRVKEYVLALYLDGQQKLLDQQLIAIGGSNFAFLEPTSIFYPAMKLPAAGVILIHNHPSGSVEPSDDDLKLTLKMEAAGELLGIELLDHLIVTTNNFFSLREHGAFKSGILEFGLTSEVPESHRFDPLVASPIDSPGLAKRQISPNPGDGELPLGRKATAVKFGTVGEVKL